MLAGQECPVCRWGWAQESPWRIVVRLGSITCHISLSRTQSHGHAKMEVRLECSPTVCSERKEFGSQLQQCHSPPFWSPYNISSFFPLRSMYALHHQKWHSGPIQSLDQVQRTGILDSISLWWGSLWCCALGTKTSQPVPLIACSPLPQTLIHSPGIGTRCMW